MTTRAWAAQSATTPLAPWSFDRRAPGPTDVHLRIEYCGVCHSDIHQARNEWGGSMYPMVPGHEIVGIVLAVGREVGRFQPGDAVAVGCMVDSCRSCANCRDGEEQYCLAGATFTYNSRSKAGELQQGGYSTEIVVDEAFVLRLGRMLAANKPAAAPLLCAGITTYSPLRHWGVSDGMRVGIVGLGGLGHMGLKFAHAFGAHVTQFTTSTSKVEDAKRLGADEVVLSNDAAAMQKVQGSFDFILDTVSAPHDLSAYAGLLRRDGALVLVGVPDRPFELPAFPLIMQRRSVGGSLIGGIAETQEMLDFCEEHGIVSDVEVIPMAKVNEAWERVVRSDVKYRFVIDCGTI
ncbi:MAG: NAD(P)-dependent alcohol dehydrogenase [Gemmatimonadales bacterium]|nr:NAD(P)-dependent alcohol dehydrogenase [Gemmatimonadales bacterium]